jgi:hypothetical protein
MLIKTRAQAQIQCLLTFSIFYQCARRFEKKLPFEICKPGANPTNVSYKASAVKMINSAVRLK